MFLPRTNVTPAEVAELADALASGASGRKAIGVRVPASAPFAAFPGLPAASRRTGAGPDGRGRNTDVEGMGDRCTISKGRMVKGLGAHFRKETLMATMTGTIKRMVSDKGFGFIAAGDGTEYFFHQSACTSTRFDDMREGQTVSFTVGQGPKGPRAENVQPQ